ncbi:MAG: SDR family oxidoreductase [Patescibacteria group bacterium]|nr:SDR family oxidoreductase [Patescibacteria group bacterium]
MGVKKNIIITGGTGGIGSNISKALVEDGHRVIIWDINPDNFEKLKNTINQNIDNISFKKVDIGSRKEVEAVAKKIDYLDILINAAAVLWPVKPFLESNLDEMKKSLDISMWGTIYTCYFLMSVLKKSNQGKIINFGGGGAAGPRENHLAYSLAKTALVRFTENISIEYPEININIIAPGAHKTNIWKDEKHDKEPEKWGDMEQLVDFFRFLVGNESDGISGRFINYRDDWNKKDFLEKIKSDPEFLTLRRIDDFQFTRIKK